MSVAGVPVQIMNQSFDFALVWAIKRFWKEYKPTFSLAQLITALQDNEQLWLNSHHRNCNETTYRASLHLSIQRLIEHAGITWHRNIVPYLYELTDYASFQHYERELVTTLYPNLIKIKFDEQVQLPFMSERSYQIWLLKQHESQNLNYDIILSNHCANEQSPCIKLLMLTEPQISYLIRKAIRFNLVHFPPFTTSIK